MNVLFVPVQFGSSSLNELGMLHILYIYMFSIVMS